LTRGIRLDPFAFTVLECPGSEQGDFWAFSEQTDIVTHRTPRHPPTRLSDDLRKILDHASGGGPITLGQMIHILHGRGFDVIVIILAFPFCTPIPLPGLSVPFGFILALFGCRIALRKRPWLPRMLLERQIPHVVMEKMITAVLKVTRYMEKVLHPRLRFFKQWASFSIVNGIVITICGLLLTLPLPIPLANGLPAFSIVLVAAGMMEEDGVAIFCGYLMAAVAASYIAFLWVFGKKGVDLLLRWLNG